MINLDYKSGITLHEQIESGIKQLIINRVWKEGQALPSVRELSVELTINPNTVQRAYKQLEQDGFIYSIKGKGSFVSNASENARETMRNEALLAFKSAVKELAFLNQEKKELLEMIERAYAEKGDVK